MTQQGPLFPSGSVSSATGTAPITVNGLSGFPETGDITIGISSSGFVNSITATAPLTANGASGSPEEGAITLALATPLSGANGGTGHANTGLVIDLSGGVTSYVLTSDSSGNATWQASGIAGSVTSITGTANEIIASSSTGAVTLSTPQAIATSSDVRFHSLGIGTAASGVAGSIICGDFKLTTDATLGYVLTSDADGNAKWQANSALGGVTSITGTANQVIASASTGAIVLSTPQSIGTSSDVQFRSIGLGTAATGSIGNVKCASIQITASPSSGYILTSDASGNGTWQANSAGGGVTSLTGTNNQILVSAATGAVTISFPTTGGLSVGSYQATSAPVGGMIMPGQLGIGTSAPDSNSLLEISKTGTAIAFSTSYGTSLGGQFICRGARGTQGSPTAPLLNDVIGTIGVRGYQSDLSSFSTTTSAGFDFTNAQNGFLSSSRGTGISVFTTAVSSSSPTACAFFTATQDVLLGTGTLSSSSNGGFAWISSSTGVPTGIPGNYAGYVPLYFDQTLGKLWVFNPTTGLWVSI